MKVYAFWAEGFEEIEALSPVVVLRHGGVLMSNVSIYPGQPVVTTVHGVPMKADTTIDQIEVSAEDILMLPGGLPGAFNLAECEALCELLVKHNAAGGKIAAICAAPLVLGKLGILKGKKATCYPGYEEYLDGAELQPQSYEVFEDGKIQTKHNEVVVDGNITTAPGPGCALPFGLQKYSNFASHEKVEQKTRDKQCFYFQGVKE